MSDIKEVSDNSVSQSELIEMTRESFGDEVALQLQTIFANSASSGKSLLELLSEAERRCWEDNIGDLSGLAAQRINSEIEILEYRPSTGD
ncbi:MAG: hypothetical protein ACYC4U_08540 [Pirellulaceae bacterium]